MSSNLTPKQRCFVDEYLVDLNATQAAIRAGYSARTAKQQASRLLTNVNVAAAVDKAKRERSEATEIDAEWVLQHAWSAIMNNNGYLRPFAFGLAMLSASFFSTVVGAISKAEPAASPSDDPRILYGGDIVFDVYRAEDKVGFHRVAFDANVLGLTVRSRFQLKIDFLFLTAFSYDYQSTAEWHGGILNKLEARVDDDGNQSKILATRAENTMRIEHAGGRLETAAPLFPTNHWNAKVLGARRVLNTLTGRVNEVRIVPRGRETVATERGPVPATRYAYTGDLDNEVWYDDVGRWVKMRFKGRDGSTIDYVCRRCQGGPTGKRTP